MRASLDRHRRASLLLDVVVALVVFVAALGAFLGLANDKTRLLESTRRQGVALAAVEAQLSRLAALSDRELLAADGQGFSVEGFPGDERGAPKGSLRVRPGPSEGTYRIELRVDWPTAGGHRRQTLLTSYRAAAGLRSQVTRER